MFLPNGASPPVVELVPVSHNLSGRINFSGRKQRVLCIRLVCRPGSSIQLKLSNAFVFIFYKDEKLNVEQATVKVICSIHFIQCQFSDC